MSDKQIVEVPELEDTREHAYEQCIRAGDRIFIAGQGGIDKDGLISSEFEPQARRAFQNIEYALGAANASLSDLVRMTVYVTDMRYSREFIDIRQDVLDGEFTTSALVGVDSLALPGMLVEIEAEAIAPCE